MQLEYSYMKYGDVVKERGRYDWRVMDRLLDRVAARRHQAIVRFYFVYPGNPTTVPNYIKAMPDYHETRGMSEGKPTMFPDWTRRELQEFTLEFYEKMAARYDNDPRLAFVETGFGLWAEYHIYSGPRLMGKTFPDKTFQAAFARQLDRVFHKTPWMISIDAADDEYAPFPDNEDLLKLSFGVFDDSFLCKEHPRVNEPRWTILDRDRWKLAPAGGEISYYTKHDQKEALSEKGPYGVRLEKAAADFHITFMIANDQPEYQPMDRIRSAGTGLRLPVPDIGVRGQPVAVAGDGHQHRRGADLSRRLPRGQRRAVRTLAQGPAAGPVAHRRDRHRRRRTEADHRLRPPGAGAVDRVRCRPDRHGALISPWWDVRL